MLCAALASSSAVAQESGATAAAGVSVELNKLESQADSCRAYLVVNNASNKSFSAFRLDLVLFQPDGVIGRRFAVDLAPIRPSKRTVKLFDIDKVKCEEVGSFLVNDVVECGSGGSAADECFAGLKVSSRTKVEFTK